MSTTNATPNADLSDAQRLAVETIDRPTLVLSAAGTGKTTVLARKFARLAEIYGPGAIAAITFTRKAASELKSRVLQELSMQGHVVDPAAAEAMLVGTFHHVGMLIIRRAMAAGILPSVQTARAEESDIAQYAAATLTETMGDESLRNLSAADQPGFKSRKAPIDGAAKTLLGDVDRIKNAGLMPVAGGYMKPDGSILPVAPGLPGVGTAGHRNAVNYQARLQAAGKYDFNDILFSAVSLLHHHRAAVAGDIKAVLIDEYQDTNHVQNEFVKALALGQHLTCVGDDDQAIYTWRGARVENILNFPADYPDALLVTLDVNYRCPAQIHEHAMQLVEHNAQTKRFKKKVSAAKAAQAAQLIHVHDLTAAYPATEGADLKTLKDEHLPIYTAQIIEEIIAGGRDPGDIVCLVRSNAEVTAIEDALDSRQIRSRLLNPNGTTSSEIKRLTAWLRVLDNPSDVAAAAMLTRSMPGDRVFNDIVAAAKNANQPVMHYILNRLKSAGIKTARFREAAIKYNDFTALAGQQLLVPTIEAICKYEIERVQSHRNTRLVELFWTTYSELMVLLDNTGSIHAAVEYLQNDLTDDDLFEANSERVRQTVDLSTIHTIKGRQKPIVVISAMIDGTLPGQTALNRRDPKSMAEERRLTYVAMTRAKEQLHIITATDRPSLFLTEAGLAKMPADV